MRAARDGGSRLIRVVILWALSCVGSRQTLAVTGSKLRKEVEHSLFLAISSFFWKIVWSASVEEQVTVLHVLQLDRNKAKIEEIMLCSTVAWCGVHNGLIWLVGGYSDVCWGLNGPHGRKGCFRFLSLVPKEGNGSRTFSFSDYWSISTMTAMTRRVQVQLINGRKVIEKVMVIRYQC
jgi:hypothetical protein